MAVEEILTSLACSGQRDLTPHAHPPHRGSLALGVREAGNRLPPADRLWKREDLEAVPLEGYTIWRQHDLVKATQCGASNALDAVRRRDAMLCDAVRCDAVCERWPWAAAVGGKLLNAGIKALGHLCKARCVGAEAAGALCSEAELRLRAPRLPSRGSV